MKKDLRKVEKKRKKIKSMVSFRAYGRDLPFFTFYFLLYSFFLCFSIECPSYVHRYSIETMDMRWSNDGVMMEYLRRKVVEGRGLLITNYELPG